MTTFYERVVGRDPNGHQRVYAETFLEAHQEAAAYTLRRPDTKPLHGWKFYLQHFMDGELLREELLT